MQGLNLRPHPCEGCVCMAQNTTPHDSSHHKLLENYSFLCDRVRQDTSALSRCRAIPVRSQSERQNMAEVNTVVAFQTHQKDVMSTQRDVDRAKPRAKRYSILDASLPGFLLRVSPNGNRAYYVRTRIGKGR